MSRLDDADGLGVLRAEMCALHVQKGGNDVVEYEDAFGFNEGWRPGVARAAVADGASEAYDAQAWVRRLVATFVADGGPAMAAEALRKWLLDRQHEWRSETPEFSTLIEEAKYQEGSYGTFLGMEIELARDHRPKWKAVAVGDTVLFHIRDGQRIATFPAMERADFANPPDLVSTQPKTATTTMKVMRRQAGEVRDGDVLLVATDALAEWAIGRADDPDEPWATLVGLEPDGFPHLVDELRQARQIQNDDVTLLIVRITSSPSPLGVGP